MAKKALTHTQEAFVVDGYLRGNMSQQSLADLYQVSRRTIQRTLQKYGALRNIHRVTDEEFNIVKVAKAYDVDAQELIRLVKQRMTPERILQFLKAMDDAALSALFYSVSMSKHAERQMQGGSNVRHLAA